MIKKIRINIMANPKTIEKVDKISTSLNMSRSELIDKILIEYYTDFEKELKGQKRLW